MLHFYKRHISQHLLTTLKDNLMPLLILPLSFVAGKWIVQKTNHNNHYLKYFKAASNTIETILRGRNKDWKSNWLPIKTKFNLTTSAWFTLQFSIIQNNRLNSRQVCCQFSNYFMQICFNEQGKDNYGRSWYIKVDEFRYWCKDTLICCVFGSKPFIRWYQNALVKIVVWTGEGDKWQNYTKRNICTWSIYMWITESVVARRWQLKC